MVLIGNATTVVQYCFWILILCVALDALQIVSVTYDSIKVENDVNDLPVKLCTCIFEINMCIFTIKEQVVKAGETYTFKNLSPNTEYCLHAGDADTLNTITPLPTPSNFTVDYYGRFSWTDAYYTFRYQVCGGKVGSLTKPLCVDTAEKNIVWDSNFVPGDRYNFSVTAKSTDSKSSPPAVITFFYPNTPVVSLIQRGTDFIALNFTVCLNGAATLCAGNSCQNFGSLKYGVLRGLKSAQHYNTSIQCTTNGPTPMASPFIRNFTSTLPEAAKLRIDSEASNFIQLSYILPNSTGANGLALRYILNGGTPVPIIGNSSIVSVLPNMKCDFQLLSLDATSLLESEAGKDFATAYSLPATPTLAPILKSIIGSSVRVSWPNVSYGNYSLSYKICLNSTCYLSNSTSFVFSNQNHGVSNSRTYLITYRVINTLQRESNPSPYLNITTGPAAPIFHSWRPLNSSSVELLVNQTNTPSSTSGWILELCLNINSNCTRFYSVLPVNTIVLNALASSTTFNSSTLKVYDNREIQSSSINLPPFSTYCQLPLSIQQYDTQEISTNLSWIQPINPSASTLPILYYHIVVYNVAQDVKVFEANTEITSIQISNLQPGCAYWIDLSINNTVSNFQSYYLRSRIITKPELPIWLKVIYHFTRVHIQWNFVSNKMINSLYRFELVGLATWTISPSATNSTTGNFSLFTNNTTTLLLTAQNELFNTSTLTFNRPETIKEVKVISIDKNSVSLSITSNDAMIQELYIQIHRMNGSVERQLSLIINSSLSTELKISNLSYATMYQFAVSSLSQVSGSVASISSMVYFTPIVVVPPKAVNFFNYSLSNQNVLMLEVEEATENPVNGLLNCKVGDLYAQLNLTTGRQNLSLSLSELYASSFYNLNCFVEYKKEGVNATIVSTVIITFPVEPKFNTLDYLQIDSKAKLFWHQRTPDPMFSISEYAVVITVNNITSEMVVNNTSLELSNLMDASKYIVHVYSINSLQVLSEKAMSVVFFTAPPKPTISLLFVEADLISLTWTVFPIQDCLINYTVSVSTSISEYKKYYVEHPTNKLAVTDLIQNTTYVVKIEAKAVFVVAIPDNVVGLTELKSEYSDPITPTTLTAELPKVAPEFKNFELLQYNTVVIFWRSIPSEMTGKSRILKYGIKIFKEFNLNQDADNFTVFVEGSSLEEHSILLEKLTAATQYNFQLFGVNQRGMSPMSNIFTFITPQDPTVESTFSMSVTVGILIPIFILFCGLIAFVSLMITLAIIVLISIKRRAKKASYIAYDLAKIQANPLLEMNDIQSSQIIPYNKLDFTNSKILGSGAQGTVITALYHSTSVAVKCFPKEVFGIQSDFSDFYNEAKILSKHSNHINIIRFIGISENNDQSAMCLITELCKGNLANYAEEIHSKNDINWRNVVAILKGIASGMSFLHSRQIGHRDLKCENILLDDDFTPKIIDFGFTKQMEQGGKKIENMTMNVGTAAYLALKQLRK